MEIQPMTPGGKWMSTGGTGTPHYVINPDHIARLLAEGYQIVDDPRSSKEDEPEVKPKKRAKK